MTKVLFMTGNKRSGTSQLARILNLHPNIFMSHESDVIWILYQFHNHLPFAAHPWDSAKGMEYTLTHCGQVLKKERSPAENFFAIQTCAMEKDNPWLPPMKKTDVSWIGDKKPFQYTDPRLIRFMLDMFPEAYFIHLLRHPFAVAASVAQFNQTVNGDFWKGLTLAEAVERWTYHEKNVLELKRMDRVKVLDVRYEDLCQETEKELRRIFAFLNLAVNERMIRRANRNMLYIIKNFPKIDCSAETQALMEQYGYKPEGVSQTGWREPRAMPIGG